MTDRELLEKAAKAADLDAVFQMYGWNEIGDGAFLDGNEPPTVWNPLTDDGDALRLACKLHINVFIYEDETSTATAGVVAKNWGSVEANTRRAIVRAAAALADAAGAA